MFTRMVIGECLSEEQIRELRSIFREQLLPELAKEQGYAGHLASV
jgi:hypothetical protein